MSAYKHIFFDLDHTLWDYDANVARTLAMLYDRHDLLQYGVDSGDILVRKFLLVNEQLWSKYNSGFIDKSYLRNERFKMVLEATGAIMKLVPDELLRALNKEFLMESPKNTILCVGAKEILEYLNTKYKVHILSNGFQDTQIVKIKSAGIDHFFDQVITSERAGSKKPLVGIFNYAMKSTKALPEESIMIGDNLKTDIAGAIKFGMDHVFFNPTKERPPFEVMHEISSLLELKNIL